MGNKKTSSDWKNIARVTLKKHSSVVVLLAIVILASCISDVFLTKNNILNVLRQITANGILSILSPTSMRQHPKEHHTYRKHRISYHLFFSLIPPSPPDRKPEPHNLPSSISQSIPVQEPHAYHPCRARMPVPIKLWSCLPNHH